MAAFDAGSHLTGNSVSTLSWTHTPVGTPTGIYVGVYSRRSASVVGDQPSSAPTYGGAATTLVGTVSDATSLIRWTWYYITAPAAAAQTVSVTFGGTSQLGCGGVAISVIGDSGANPSATLASAAGNSTTLSVTPVAPGANDIVLLAGASNTASAGFTTGAGMSTGQVQVFVDNTGNNDWDTDYRPGSSAAAMTHTVTTGTWFGSTINVPGAAPAATAVVRIPNPYVGPMALRHLMLLHQRPYAASTTQAGIAQALASAITGTGAVTAQLAVARPLQAAIPGLGAVTAQLAVKRPLAASITGTGAVSTATTAPQVARALQAAITGTGAVSATKLNVTRPLRATATGTGAVSALLAVKRALNAGITGTGAVSATLTNPNAGGTQALERMLRRLGV